MVEKMTSSVSEPFVRSSSGATTVNVGAAKVVGSKNDPKLTGACKRNYSNFTLYLNRLAEVVIILSTLWAILSPVKNWVLFSIDANIRGGYINLREELTMLSSSRLIDDGFSTSSATTAENSVPADSTSFKSTLVLYSDDEPIGPIFPVASPDKCQAASSSGQTFFYLGNPMFLAFSEQDLAPTFLSPSSKQSGKSEARGGYCLQTDRRKFFKLVYVPALLRRVGGQVSSSNDASSGTSNVDNQQTISFPEEGAIESFASYSLAASSLRFSPATSAAAMSGRAASISNQSKILHTQRYTSLLRDAAAAATAASAGGKASASIGHGINQIMEESLRDFTSDPWFVLGGGGAMGTYKMGKKDFLAEEEVLTDSLNEDDMGGDASLSASSTSLMSCAYCSSLIVSNFAHCKGLVLDLRNSLNQIPNFQQQQVANGGDTEATLRTLTDWCTNNGGMALAYSYLATGGRSRLPQKIAAVWASMDLADRLEAAVDYLDGFANAVWLDAAQGNVLRFAGRDNLLSIRSYSKIKVGTMSDAAYVQKFLSADVLVVGNEMGLGLGDSWLGTSRFLEVNVGASSFLWASVTVPSPQTLYQTAGTSTVASMIGQISTEAAKYAESIRRLNEVIANASASVAAEAEGSGSPDTQQLESSLHLLSRGVVMSMARFDAYGPGLTATGLKACSDLYPDPVSLDRYSNGSATAMPPYYYYPRICRYYTLGTVKIANVLYKPARLSTRRDLGAKLRASDTTALISLVSPSPTTAALATSSGSPISAFYPNLASFVTAYVLKSNPWVFSANSTTLSSPTATSDIINRWTVAGLDGFCDLSKTAANNAYGLSSVSKGSLSPLSPSSGQDPGVEIQVDVQLTGPHLATWANYSEAFRYHTTTQSGYYVFSQAVASTSSPMKNVALVQATTGSPNFISRVSGWYCKWQADLATLSGASAFILGGNSSRTLQNPSGGLDNVIPVAADKVKDARLVVLKMTGVLTISNQTTTTTTPFVCAAGLLPSDFRKALVEYDEDQRAKILSLQEGQQLLPFSTLSSASSLVPYVGRANLHGWSTTCDIKTACRTLPVYSLRSEYLCTRGHTETFYNGILVVGNLLCIYTVWLIFRRVKSRAYPAFKLAREGLCAGDEFYLSQLEVAEDVYAGLSPVEKLVLLVPAACKIVTSLRPDLECNSSRGVREMYSYLDTDEFVHSEIFSSWTSLWTLGTIATIVTASRNRVDYSVWQRWQEWIKAVAGLLLLLPSLAGAVVMAFEVEVASVLVDPALIIVLIFLHVVSEMNSSRDEDNISYGKRALNGILLRREDHLIADGPLAISGFGAGLYDAAEMLGVDMSDVPSKFARRGEGLHLMALFSGKLPPYLRIRRSFLPSPVTSLTLGTQVASQPIGLGVGNMTPIGIALLCSSSGERQTTNVGYENQNPCYAMVCLYDDSTGYMWLVPPTSGGSQGGSSSARKPLMIMEDDLKVVTSIGSVLSVLVLNARGQSRTKSTSYGNKTPSAASSTAVAPSSGGRMQKIDATGAAASICDIRVMMQGSKAHGFYA